MLEFMPPSKFSIVIPFYRGESFILNLLHSLFVSLQSSEKKVNVETIIVLDSLLTDVILEKQLYTYSDLNVKLISNDKNMGVAYSRNKGMEFATGDYITFIDQDDFVSIYYFHSLEDMLNKKDVDLIWMNGYLRLMEKGKNVVMFPIRPSFQIQKFIYNNIIPTPSFLIVKKEKITKYNISFYQREISDKIVGVDDWFFILQLLIKKTDDFVVEYIDVMNIYYCLHSDNYSHNLDKMINSAVNLLTYLNSKYDLHQYKIENRIATLFYMKFFYKNKIKAFLSHPFLFIRTVQFYLMDINRFFRHVLRLIEY